MENRNPSSAHMDCWRLPYRPAFAAVLFLGAPLAIFAQQSTQPSPAPASGSQTQVPNAPSPNAAPAATEPPAPAQPAPSASGWSSSSTSPSSASPKPPLRYWASSDPNAQVTVLENTLLSVRTNQPIGSKQTHTGASLSFTLSDDVIVDGVLIVPRGALLHGTTVEVKRAGTLTGAPDLVLQLTQLDLGGRSYPLYTYQFKVVGTSKTQPTETKIRNGAAVGSVVGAILLSGNAKGPPTAMGRLTGTGTGAALGAGIGTAISAAAPGPIVSLPTESEIDFYLASPISVVPASEKEARRLSQGLDRGGPVLYVRGDVP